MKAQLIAAIERGLARAGRRGTAVEVRWPRRRHSHGQALLEAALGLPFVVVLCLGVADGGRAFYYREDVTNAARQALRVAMNDQTDGNSACVSNTASTPTHVTQTAHIPFQSGTDPSAMQTIANAVAQEGQDGSGNSKIAGGFITVTWHCESGTAITNSTSGVGLGPASDNSAAVEVNICYPFSLWTPIAGKVFGSRSCPGQSTTGVSIAADFTGRVSY